MSGKDLHTRRAHLAESFEGVANRPRQGAGEARGISSPNTGQGGRQSAARHFGNFDVCGAGQHARSSPSNGMSQRAPLAGIPDRFSQHGVKLALAQFLGLPPHCLARHFFSTGRAQAANNAGSRLGTGLILGFDVGGLRPRFRSRRVSLPQTALRLHPRRRAICAALCPIDQSSLSSATSFASQLMEGTIRRLSATG